MKNELLAKYILDEASAKERQIVERWLDESEEHQREYQQIKRQVELGGMRYKHGFFDHRKAVRKIDFPAKRRSVLIFRIAAAIIIILIAVGWWNWLQPQTIWDSNTGETMVFYLSDDSRVVLSEDSHLTCDTDFNQSNRKLHLQGEAFFMVKQDTEKPFVVKTSFIQVEALGTSFRVLAREFQTEVFVEKGRVKITTLDNQQDEILETGMSIKYEKVEDKIIIQSRDTLMTPTNIFRFENITLYEMFEKLNKHYGSHVVVPDEYKFLRITVIFGEVPLEKVIEIVNITLDIQLTI